MPAPVHVTYRVCHPMVVLLVSMASCALTELLGQVAGLKTSKLAQGGSFDSLPGGVIPNA